MEQKDIRSFTLAELKKEMEFIGEKAFRSKQIYEWLHVKLADSFEEMTNLSKPLREKISRSYVIRMGCRFCASTIGGLVRNLAPSEMLGQIYAIQRLTGERVSNVVVMGTGEPLDNYENIVKFIHMLSDENGLHISQRNITLATCGIVPNMKRLAKENLQITLALSLHGATQEKRRKLMPVANKYELSEVMKACDEYFENTGRRMTFEYSLVHGVNDTEEDAKELIALLGRRNCHLNLIPVNPIKERDYVRPTRESALNFKNRLEK